MILLIETIVLCLLMWLICFVSVGGDNKNIKNFYTYPKTLQNKILNDEKFKDKIPKKQNEIVKFLSNFAVYLVIIFILGIFIRTNKFLNNFISLLILGETLNLFDFLIIDLCWWQNSKKIRFLSYQDKSLYRGAKNHFISFLKGFLMFLIIALLDGAILILF